MPQKQPKNCKDNKPLYGCTAGVCFDKLVPRDFVTLNGGVVVWPEHQPIDV